MQILAVSDIVLPQLQHAENLQRIYGDVKAVISCGDMPAEYLEYIVSTLCVPLFFVRGNHDVHYRNGHPGGENLHGRVVNFKGITLAGLEGSIRYNQDPVKYTEAEMYKMVLGLWPKVLFHRLRYRRGIDIMVTHSPPRDIHDTPGDYAHRGFKSFRLLMRLYRPRYLIHGHVDTSDSRKATQTTFRDTEVININPVKLMTFERR